MPRMTKPLLVVAGPSGAGKSTCMSQLAAGVLSNKVKGHLPHGASARVHSSGE
jgi:ribose 1,5-bisphosphokinase PhnN